MEGGKGRGNWEANEGEREGKGDIERKRERREEGQASGQFTLEGRVGSPWKQKCLCVLRCH